MGNFTKIFLFILVALSIFDVVDGHRKRKKHRKCPCRDDEDHVCGELKTKSYLITVSRCQQCEQPTAEHPFCRYRKYYSRRLHQYVEQYFCWYTYTVNVTRVECEVKCCEGWTLGEDGECSVQTSPETAPSTQIVCENGGSPAGDVCSCLPGFVGTNCETPDCNPPCLNNGVCNAEDNKAVCVCPEDKFTGKQCEIPVCKQPCQNGGTCMVDGYDAKCMCAPGFYGDSCEQEMKDGDCPDVSGVGLCYTDCSYDMDCTGSKKCCPNACGGNVCTYPKNSTCTYNGQQFPLGHVTQTTPCSTCFCKHPDKQGDSQWECTQMICPRLLCPHTKTLPGLCCPVCDDTPTTLPVTSTATPKPTTPNKLKTTCVEKGVTYPLGHVIHRNGFCEQCTCTISKDDDYADWTCMVIDCMWYPDCLNVRYIDGQCCPVCDDKSTTPAPQTSRPTTSIPTLSCHDNGMEYPIGSPLPRGKCETCVCEMQPSGIVDWHCRRVACPYMRPDCNLQFIEGQCCPVCVEPNPTTKNPESAPTFKNCPNGILTLHTNHENFVDIRKQLNLEVIDSSGRKYDVKYTKERIYAKPCNCSDNYHIIGAQSEVDQFGRFASCVFTVHVFDNHPPIYKTCPSSVDGFDDEIIGWDKPEPEDNVAVKLEKLQSMFENNSKFKVGSHVVVYVATDHQGNIGICNFLVRIYSRETTNPDTQKEEQNEHQKERSLMINAVIGTLAGLILLTLLAILMMCYRRRKSCSLARANDNETRGYDNAIYNTPDTPPPSYGHSDGLKYKLPPEYMIKDEKPPLYEEIDVKELAKRAIHNPVYESDAEVDVKNIKPHIREDTDA